MLSPLQESRRLIREFYVETGYMYQARKHAIIAVNLTIKALERNSFFGAK